jgi:Ca-activated chloride channel homolog
MKASVITFAIIMFLSSPLYADAFGTLVEKGNSAFKENDYKTALDFYHQAEVEKPETPELDFNIGTALHKEGNYEEAIEKFQKSMATDNVQHEAGALYNIGNTQFRMEDYQAAIQSYQKSLELAPDDIDTKYNLELARIRLKEQMQQQKQDPQQQQQQEQQQQQQPQDDQQEEQQDQQQQQDEKDKQDDKEQKQEQPQQVNENDMSKEDAERILNALRDDEKDVQKDLKRFPAQGNYGGNDW